MATLFYISSFTYNVVSTTSYMYMLSCFNLINHYFKEVAKAIIFTSRSPNKSSEAFTFTLTWVLFYIWDAINIGCFSSSIKVFVQMKENWSMIQLKNGYLIFRNISECRNRLFQTVGVYNLNKKWVFYNLN